MPIGSFLLGGTACETYEHGNDGGEGGRNIVVLVDYLHSGKRGELCPRPAWEHAWAKRQEAYKLAYGRAVVKPKHHSALHVGRRWEGEGVYFDCLSGERKNASSNMQYKLSTARSFMCGLR